jgi:hypothetical protein
MNKISVWERGSEERRCVGLGKECQG